MAERDLVFHLLAENSQLKAKLAESTTQVEQFKAANAGVVPGATAAAAALTEQAAASGVAAAAATQQATQQNTVVVALGEARDAMRRFTAESLVGGESQVAAARGAAKAIAQVHIAILETRAAGGIVTPAQVAAVEAYTARLQGTAAQLGGASAATAAATGHSRLFTVATSQAGQAIAGKTVNLGAMNSALLRTTGALGGMVAGAALLPSLLDTIDKKTQEWSNALVDLVTGIYDEDVAVRKLTDAVKAANASSDLYRISQGSLAVGTRDVRDSIRALGFEIGEGFSASLSKANDFISAYNALLKAEGAGAAKEFAELNKRYIGEAIDGFAALGKEVPAQLRAIADEFGILSSKEKEFAANRELSEKWAEEMSAANLLIGVIKTSVSAKEDEFAVTGRLAKQINEEIVALTNLKTTSAAQEVQRKASLQTLTDLAIKHGILTGKLNELLAASLNAGAGLKRIGDGAAEGAAAASEAVDGLIADMIRLEVQTKKNQKAAEEAFGAGPIPAFGHSPLVGAFSTLNASGSNLAPGSSNATSTSGPAVGSVGGRQVIGRP